ncbi:hypothetical protein HBI56_110930 [Parastagonospora nodorum]|nr:hypothetical protein HBH52_143370 [Parastagonospora nodorum]KAH3980539.1 hypothetical protein HBH51_049300 [Parastagonospora nodorum]KAH4038556.1 hypothetical protein HBI09_052820 [Parastagonospora nodorum]KAH4055591.1 hypothetical protein HBH49_061210 [Parastagonospora nodorum]KAH4102211.1 hypothetical protein HBH46_129970 [Parastagonospora nodorum]
MFIRKLTPLLALFCLLTLATAQLVPTTSANGCVSGAVEYCNKQVWPPGSPDLHCMSVSDTPWSNEMALMRSKCYCLRKDLQQTWWTCFYQQAALCPKDQVTMREIWHQEWEVHRYQRRLYCLDDYKPSPPWHLINNNYMKMHYNMLRPYQYSYEFAQYRKRDTNATARRLEMV